MPTSTTHTAGASRDRRIRRLVAGFWSSLGAGLGLGTALQMGIGFAYVLVTEQRDLSGGRAMRTPLGDWNIEHGESLRSVGTFINLAVVGILLLIVLARLTKSAVGVLRSQDPLSARLGGRKSSWRLTSEETAEAMASALTKLRGEDFAGAGDLSVSADDEGGDLSFPAPEGGLSVDTE